MTRLSIIKDTVQQVAEAVTAALELETEIIDSSLTIIAGTGRYKKKVGLLEEDGDLESGYIYGQLLKSGETYINENPSPDPPYGARENEQAEICCPISLEDEIIGLIALVAFSQKQKRKLLANCENNLKFLSRMAFLIGAKVAQVEIANELSIIVENIREGILVTSTRGLITNCNSAATKILQTEKNNLIGTAIKDLWGDIPIKEVILRKIRYEDLEKIYKDNNQIQKHLLISIDPILIDDPKLESGGKICTGTLVTFREFQEMKKKIYNMTDKLQAVRFADILGNSHQIRDSIERSMMIAETNSTVLITGESGTGKELFARAIHFNSQRKTEPFITVNCGAIPETLLETELFGYDSGAFTGAHKGGKAGKFEIAHKGTIFLDEIGDLPLHLQVKLLHVLQRREVVRVGSNHIISVNVRVLAATNHNLAQMVEDGEFREDLYYRLCVIPLHIPSLRERKEDLETLLFYFLDKFNLILNKNIKGFETDALALLKVYDWPGNVRELENAMEYATSFEKGVRISLVSIQPRIRQSCSPDSAASNSLFTELDQLERKIIIKQLKQSGYNTKGKRAAAKNLGISESTLYRRIRNLGIKP
ncbi:MAG: PAS domain-containing protein [Firmicutes bacterium]|nr:PAS domain-containing protein [Bacillota bacterium]